MMTDKSVLPLTKVLMNGLKTRFMDIMSSDDYNIATMLVPQFKLNYLEQSQRSIKRALLVEAVKKMEVSEVVTTTVQAAAVALNSPLKEINDTPEDLYSYMISENTDKQNADLVEEIDTYLSRTETNIELLFQYPRLLLAFTRYNATLPSSAAVERLFSAAGQILVPRRCKMSDNLFEQSVFLRYKLKQK